MILAENIAGSGQGTAPAPSVRADDQRRSYRLVIRRMTMASCGVGLLVQPVSAYLSGISPWIAAAIWVGSGLLWCFTRVSGAMHIPSLVKHQALSLTLVATVMGLYACNLGTFGTVVDPGLFAFGLATILTLDGSRLSLASGVTWGTGVITVCTIWAPGLYFGANTELLPVHALFHIAWWVTPLCFGHMIGRRIQTIIADLVHSRRALQEAQEREIAAAAAAEQVRARASGERLETLSSIAAAFDAQMQSGMHSLLALSGVLEAGAASAERAALGARDDGDAVAKLADTASSESDAVAFATEQLSHTIGHVHEQIAAAAAASLTARRMASESDHALQALTGTARRVDAMVEMIHSISKQTNLLAINAAIEAAHAGEIGQGFAVVAGEVKRLAHQTTGATVEIRSLVNAMKAALAEMAAAMGEVRQSTETMSGITGVIARAMDEQTEATNAIAGTVSSVARRTAATSERVLQLIGRIRDTSDANRAMLEGAATMRVSSADLQSRACDFAEQLRAG